jgi:histidyl-tRNA synthetase
MENAPSIIDHLCSDCARHFEVVQQKLKSLGVPFLLDKRLVRGLDYYTRTTFEIQTTSLGAQSAVAGGGRYDGLVEMLGGPDMPATGFAIGFDRLTEVVNLEKEAYYKKPVLYIAALDEKSRSMAFEWICMLGRDGFRAEMDFEGRSLKSQMKRADRCGARHALIVGEDEQKKGSAILRNMSAKEQVDVPLHNLVENIKPLIQ